MKFVGREEALEVVAAGCQQSGMWADAMVILNEILEIQMSRRASPVETMHGLANAYLQQKDFMNASEWCKDTLQMRIASVGRKYILFYHTLHLRTRIYRQQGDLEDAEYHRVLILVNLLEGILTPQPKLLIRRVQQMR